MVSGTGLEPVTSGVWSTMGCAILLKPQALRTTYLTYSSYKTPDFRPTDRPTDFGQKELQRLVPPMRSLPTLR
jgi:hypothetical protein